MLEISIQELFVAWKTDEPSAFLLRVLFRVRPLLAEALSAIYGTTELTVLHLGLELITACAGRCSVRAITGLHELLVYLFS